MKSKITPVRNRINYIKSNKLFCVSVTDLTTEKKMDTTEMIAELCKIHEELCDTCYLIEEYFSHQMVTVVAINFITFLFNIYYIVEMVVGLGDFHNAELERTAFIAFFVYYTVVSSVSLLYAVYLSDCTIVEVGILSLKLNDQIFNK